jgi:hypothetical protein
VIAGFQHVGTIRLPRIGRPAFDGAVWHWRPVSTFRGEQGLRAHLQVIGDGNEVIEPETGVDLDARNRIGHDQHDVGNAIDGGIADCEFAFGPDFNNSHGESPAQSVKATPRGQAGASEGEAA